MTKDFLSAAVMLMAAFHIWMMEQGLMLFTQFYFVEKNTTFAFVHSSYKVHEDLLNSDKAYQLTCSQRQSKVQLMYAGHDKNLQYATQPLHRFQRRNSTTLSIQLLKKNFNNSAWSSNICASQLAHENLEVYITKISYSRS